jgi:hypothetical protein
MGPLDSNLINKPTKGISQERIKTVTKLANARSKIRFAKLFKG